MTGLDIHRVHLGLDLGANDRTVGVITLDGVPVLVMTDEEMERAAEQLVQSTPTHRGPNEVC